MSKAPLSLLLLSLLSTDVFADAESLLKRHLPTEEQAKRRRFGIKSPKSYPEESSAPVAQKTPPAPTPTKETISELLWEGIKALPAYPSVAKALNIITKGQKIPMMVDIAIMTKRDVSNVQLPLCVAMVVTERGLKFGGPAQLTKAKILHKMNGIYEVLEVDGRLRTVSEVSKLVPGTCDRVQPYYNIARQVYSEMSGESLVGLTAGLSKTDTVMESLYAEFERSKSTSTSKLKLPPKEIALAFESWIKKLPLYKGIRDTLAANKKLSNTKIYRQLKGSRTEKFICATLARQSLGFKPARRPVDPLKLILSKLELVHSALTNHPAECAQLKDAVAFLNKNDAKIYEEQIRPYYSAVQRILAEKEEAAPKKGDTKAT